MFCKKTLIGAAGILVGNSFGDSISLNVNKSQLHYINTLNNNDRRTLNTAYADQSSFKSHQQRTKFGSRIEQESEKTSGQIDDIQRRSEFYAPKLDSKQLKERIRPQNNLSDLRKKISENAQTIKINSKDKNNKILAFSSCSYQSNRVIEDTFAIETQLKPAKGMLFGVFDGHGGYATANFCKNELFKFLIFYYSKHFENRINNDSLRKNFQKLIDKKAFLMADLCQLTRSYAENKIKDGLSGACAIVSHVLDNQIIVGNAGDCRCIVARRINSEGDKNDLYCNDFDNSVVNTKNNANFGSTYKAIQLSNDHQIRTNSKERERLLHEHPNELNVIHRGRIKGRLEPTRGFGDGKYKRMEYFLNTNDCNNELVWTPPYTTSEPEITQHKIISEDEFMIIASDGLFQDLTSQQVVNYATNYLQEQSENQQKCSSNNNSLNDCNSIKLNLSAHLIEKALLAASEEEYGRLGLENNLNLVMNLEPGRERRRVHDDVTVLVVFFSNLKNEPFIDASTTSTITSNQYDSDEYNINPITPPTLEWCLNNSVSIESSSTDDISQKLKSKL